MTQNSISDYIQELFPQFEPALKEKLIAHVAMKSFKAGGAIDANRAVLQVHRPDRKRKSKTLPGGNGWQ